MMLRIGKAAAEYHISKRTLRHWEDEGILSSAREENGYRYYDEENVLRIRQIVLLRNLRMPIAEIERIFKASEEQVAMDALVQHLKALKEEQKATAALIAMLDNCISHIQSQQGLPQLLSGLEEIQTALFTTDSAPQNKLPERKRIMQNRLTEQVRIVRLPAMIVAAYRAESETPEKDCAEVMNEFIFSNRLHEKSGFRHFGFNNPNPTEGNPVYGYEMWVSIPNGFAVPSPLEKKEYPGGLYASITTTIAEIGERWLQLYHWGEASDKYAINPDAQWMEETIDFETAASVPEGERQLDLLMPIKPIK